METFFPQDILYTSLGATTLWNFTCLEVPPTQSYLAHILGGFNGYVIDALPDKNNENQLSL